MQLYGIGHSEVEAALANPDATTPTELGRTNAWKRRGAAWLRVTYIHERDDVVVVTATPRRTGPGG
jgi:hypothetical protein